MTNDEPGVPNTDPETIDPAGHMADLIESGAVDMELAADADRDEMREFLEAVDTPSTPLNETPSWTTNQMRIRTQRVPRGATRRHISPKREDRPY